MESRIIKSNGWPAPAKINLFLHITRRRDDGYHLLQTAFQFIDLVDDLDYTCRDDGKITLTSNYENVAPEADLNFRAAHALQSASGCHSGVDININKQLPLGGGLGGGSSNAATTLVALNHLWQLDLSKTQLLQIGLELGADVPVFIHGHAAWAEGVGEQLTDIDPEELYYLIINPGCQVSTAEIFAAADLTRNTPPITIRDFLRDGGHNDCEAVVRSHYPEIGEAINWLNHHTEATLTGTGACIFGAFESKSKAEFIADQLPGKWQGFVAKGLNHSPLLDRLAQEQG